MDIGDVFQRLLPGGTLNEAEAEGVFGELLTGGLDEPRMAAMLSLIQSRGPTTGELIGAARAMRRFVTPVPAGPESPGTRGPVIDTCGTGGAPKTFNISTASAVVTAAAAGPGHARVAKHGNRSRSGRGSAEVLAALDVNVDASPEIQARCLDQVGVCFCFAIHAHPAMKHAAGVRRSLGFPTIFNLLGPLTNPARASRQVIGVYGRDEASKVAGALAGLGSARAMVVHGFDGIDEITTRDRTHVFHVADGAVTHETFDPASLGVRRAEPGMIEAPDLARGVEILRGVIAGDPDPALAAARAIVELNSAAALLVAGAADDLASGIEMAREAIASGRAARTLSALIECSRAG
ncbi:MAG TPA: anthranilate phosphoribosyltransferase [Phycisphaerales bacterium]|nr:anthranilate phosphoribosyltransferase [Phycisphaerales bacterium]